MFRLDTNKILRYIIESTLQTQRERDVSGNCVSFPPCYVLWIEFAISGSRAYLTHPEKKKLKVLRS